MRFSREEWPYEARNWWPVGRLSSRWLYNSLSRTGAVRVDGSSMSLFSEAVRAIGRVAGSKTGALAASASNAAMMALYAASAAAASAANLRVRPTDVSAGAVLCCGAVLAPAIVLAAATLAAGLAEVAVGAVGGGRRAEIASGEDQNASRFLSGVDRALHEPCPSSTRDEGGRGDRGGGEGGARGDCMIIFWLMPVVLVGSSERAPSWTAAARGRAGRTSAIMHKKSNGKV